MVKNQYIFYQYIVKNRQFISTFCSTFAKSVQEVHWSTYQYEWPPCLLCEISQKLVQMIATTRSKSLQSFKAMPTFLTEIWRHKILTSCRIINDVITPSISDLDLSLPNRSANNSSHNFPDSNWSQTRVLIQWYKFWS